LNVKILRQFDQRALALDHGYRYFRLKCRAVMPAWSSYQMEWLPPCMMPQLCGKSTYPGFADFRSHLSRTTNLPTEWNQAHDTQIQREYGLHEKTRQFGSGLHPID